MNCRQRSTNCVMSNGQPTSISLIRAAVTLTAGQEHSLGFLPPAAYQQALKRGRLAWHLEGSEVVGIAVYGGTPPWIRIHQIYVNPNQRNIDIGVSLVVQMLDHYRHWNINAIMLRCAEDLDSHLFWTALGFQPIGLTRHDQFTHRQLVIHARFFKCQPPAALYSTGFFTSLEPGLAAISATSRSTPRDAESSCGILAHRQLIRPPSHRSVSEIDSRWPFSGGNSYRWENVRGGKNSLSSLESLQPDTTSICTSHSASTRQRGKSLSLEPKPHYFPRR